jgi:hypothetical protein
MKFALASIVQKSFAQCAIVGHYNGSQARDVLYTLEQWEQMKERG